MATTLRRSALTFWMIASGTPVGAISTIQPLDTTPGTVSLIAGRFGRLGSRFGDAMPSSRMPPPWMPGCKPASPSNMIGMRPAITSLSDAAAPAACTNEMFALERSRNSSPVRCAWPPRLVAPNSMPPWVLLASAISSATLLAGTSLLTATAIGCSPTMPIGANVFCRSNGILPSCWIGSTVKVEACVM